MPKQHKGDTIISDTESKCVTNLISVTQVNTHRCVFNITNYSYQRLVLTRSITTNQMCYLRLVWTKHVTPIGLRPEKIMKIG